MFLWSAAPSVFVGGGATGTSYPDAPPGYSEALKEQSPVPRGAFIQPVQYMVRLWMAAAVWFQCE